MNDEQAHPVDQDTDAGPATGRDQPPDAGGADGAAPSQEQVLGRLGDHTDGRKDSIRSDRILSRGIGRLGAEPRVTNVFQGNFTVEGDFTTGGGRGGRNSGRGTARTPVGHAELAEHTDHYVEPTTSAHLVDHLDRTHLLIIAGPRRTGRYSAALATLRSLYERLGRAPEFELLKGSALGNQGWRVPVRDKGFVLVDEGPGRRSNADGIDDAWLARTSEALQESGSHLVVVTGPPKGDLATTSRRDEYVVDLDVPDPMEIVRKRIRVDVPFIPEDEWLPRLAETALAEMLDERGDPHFAARAAKALADGLLNGQDLGGIVARLRNPGEQVREWIGSDPTNREIAFTLATAVLEESSYLTVADAAITLLGKLGGTSGQASPRYLGDLRDERGWIEIVAQDDPDRPPLVRLRHADLRAQVLAAVWYELDGARPKLSEWLGALVEHQDVEVRARAAVAAGIIAAGDIQHALHRYLIPWAGAPSGARRESAALAVNTIASFAGLTERAWQLVDSWAVSVGWTDQRPWPAATAAIAVGSQLGDRNPGRALRVLRTLVCDGDWTVLEPSAVSAQLLIERGHGAEVLRALIEWTERGNTEQATVKALTIFVVACGAPEIGACPTLLAEALDHREDLPELWGRALAHDTVRGLAVQALRAWVVAAEPGGIRDTGRRDALLDLLAGIADRGEYDLDRVLHLLSQWAEDPEVPLAVAADLHDELIDLLDAEGLPA